VGQRVISIVLAQKKLFGTLQTTIGNLNGSNNFDLNHNSIAGSLPTEVGYLNSIYALCSYNNQLDGSLPWQLGWLTNTVFLEIDSNHFSSNLPTQLGWATALQFLHLFNNDFVGEIPSQFGALTGLKELYLAGGTLTGKVPGTLCHLPKDCQLDFTQNPTLECTPSCLSNPPFTGFKSDLPVCDAPTRNPTPHPVADPTPHPPSACTVGYTGFALYNAAYRSAASTTGAKLPPDAFVLLPGLLKMVLVLWSNYAMFKF
jgi:hypothetical protein